MKGKGVPASAGVDLKLGVVDSSNGQAVIVRPGNRNERFGAQERLGKDGCGY